MLSLRKPVGIVAFVVLAIAVTTLTSGCGGGEKESGINSAVTPTAVPSSAPSLTPAPSATPAPSPTIDPLASLPVYPGATKIASGNWADASSIPGADSMAAVLQSASDENIQALLSDPNTQFAIYQTDGSAQDVAAWYHEKNPDVPARLVFSGGLSPSAYVVQMNSPNGAAIVGDVDGVTEFGLWVSPR